MFDVKSRNNWDLRTGLVEEIAVLNSLLMKYNDSNNQVAAMFTRNRLIEAHYYLYEANKEFDADLTAYVAATSGVKKTFWQKLLRK